MVCKTNTYSDDRDTLYCVKLTIGFDDQVSTVETLFEEAMKPKVRDTMTKQQRSTLQAWAGQVKIQRDAARVAKESIRKLILAVCKLSFV